MSPPEREIRPGGDATETDSNTHQLTHHHHAEVKNQCSRRPDKAPCTCGDADVCVCEFYAEWWCDWYFPQDWASQDTRRRHAEFRSAPLLHSGHRDPWLSGLRR
jgi:hypothetical protein